MAIDDAADEHLVGREGGRNPATNQIETDRFNGRVAEYGKGVVEAPVGTAMRSEATDMRRSIRLTSSYLMSFPLKRRFNEIEHLNVRF